MLDRLFLLAAAVDIFLAVDSGMAHQGELLGQGTDLYKTRA